MNKRALPTLRRVQAVQRTVLGPRDKGVRVVIGRPPWLARDMRVPRRSLSHHPWRIHLRYPLHAGPSSTPVVANRRVRSGALTSRQQPRRPRLLRPHRSGKSRWSLKPALSSLCWWSRRGHDHRFHHLIFRHARCLLHLSCHRPGLRRNQFDGLGRRRQGRVLRLPPRPAEVDPYSGRPGNIFAV